VVGVAATPAAGGGARRVGVFGGTFDPVHIGHLIGIEEARWALDLTEIVVVPAARPPHKLADPMSAAAHRLRMLALAVAGVRGLRISRVDLDRPGPHYTVETLALLRAEAPPQTELVFLMGADSLVELPEWRDPPGILALASLGVLRRPGSVYDLAALEAQIPGLRGRTIEVAMPLIGVSSTEIRARAATGRPIRYQVPDAVEAYIREQGLYRPRG
jgi:nicotinate-nucleotide adenylyltransferase